MEFVRVAVERGIEPDFLVIDTAAVTSTTAQAGENPVYYDYYKHCLAFSPQLVKKRKIKLIANSFTFHKILLFLNYLD